MAIRVQTSSGGIGEYQQGISLSVPGPSEALLQGMDRLASGFRDLSETNKFLAQKEKEAKDADYVATAGIEAQTKLQDLRSTMEQEFRDSPEGFAKAFAERSAVVYDDVLANAPSREAKTATKYQFGGQMRGDFNQSTAWEKGALVDRYVAKYDEGFNMLAASAFQNPASFDQAVANHNALLAAAESYLDVGQVNKLRQQGRESLAASTLQGMIGINPAAAKQAIASGKFNDFLGDRLGTYAEAADRGIEAQAAKADRELMKARMESANAFDVALVRAQDTSDLNNLALQLEGMQANGTVDGSQYASRYEGIRRMAKDAAEKEEAVYKVSASLQTGLPLDSTNKDDRKAVDEYYKSQFLPLLEGLGQEEANGRITAFVRNTGVIPDTLRSQLNGALNSGNETVAARTADTVYALVNADPRFLRQLDDKAATMAETIVGYRESGLSALDAARSARGQVVDKSSPVYKQYEQNFVASKKGFDIERLSQWFRIEPDEGTAPLAMQAEWDSLYKLYAVEKQMPLDKAEEAAYKTLSSKWGTSQFLDASVIGKAVPFFRTRRWSRNSPDRVYGIPGQSDDWMQDSLVESLKTSSSVKTGKVNLDRVLGSATSTTRALADFIPFVDTSPKFQIVPDPGSATTTRPGYLIMYEGEDGAFDYFRDETGTKPLIWTPDFTKTSAYTEQQGKVKADAEKLRKASDYKRLQELKSQNPGLL